MVESSVCRRCCPVVQLFISPRWFRVVRVFKTIFMFAAVRANGGKWAVEGERYLFSTAALIYTALQYVCEM